MPYITTDDRFEITVGRREPKTPGELNFAITKLVNDYLVNTPPPSKFGYTAINTAIGVLECAKLELYRRIAGPYEDTKRKENGEVYHPRIVTL